jgi:hypothetical protein
MTRIVTAIFDGQVLRPESALDIKPNTRCRITVESPADATEGENVWDVLDGAVGSVKAPADWATEHDHYLYGTPKQAKAGQ